MFNKFSKVKYLPLDDFLKTNLAKFAILSEICHLSEKASEGKFFGPDKLPNQTNDGKGKEKRKSTEEERRKEKIAMVALLGIIMATLEIVLDELLDTKVLLPNYCVNTKRRDSHHWNNIYIYYKCNGNKPQYPDWQRYFLHGFRFRSSRGVLSSPLVALIPLRSLKLTSGTQGKTNAFIYYFFIRRTENGKWRNSQG